MREDIIRVLNASERSLDASGIMNAIKPEYTRMELEYLLADLEMLCKEGTLYQRNDGKYMLFERSNLLKGKLQVISSGAGFVLLENGDLYIPKNNINGANDKDSVIAEITKNKGNKKEGRIVRILERNLGSSLAEVYFINGKPFLKLADPELAKKYNLIFDTSDLNLVEGLIVKIEIVKEINKKDFAVKIDKVIGHKNSPDIDTLKICSEFNIETDWNAEVLEEIKTIPSVIDETEIVKRRDLREEMIFTIDGADTKDVDDAVSIKKLPNGNYELGVHIADVSHYVKEGSAIKKTALHRGNSVYLADRVIPMLPVELSNGICSLNPNVDRLAFSCVMEIDSSESSNGGNIVKYDIFKSVIRSKKKMTYDNVNKVFDNQTPEDYKEFENDLNQMRELYEILEKTAIRKGKLDFISDEVKLIVDEKGKIIEVKKYETGIGQKLIENFMIAANTAVGTHVYNMSLPFVYRVHDIPSPEKLKEFVSFVSILGHRLIGKPVYEGMKPKELQSILVQLKEFKEYEILNKKLLRCMKKAAYSMDNIGHFGLALDNYSHFTSPIRRYSDTMVHYFLTEYLVNNNYSKDFVSYWNNSLPYICDHISKTEVDAEDCEREVDDLKIAEYMEGHIGEVYEATIDGCLSKGFFVVTKNLISGFVSLDTLKKFYFYDEELMAYLDKKKRICFRIGDKVKVKCIAASKLRRQVDFTLCEDEGNGNIQ